MVPKNWEDTTTEERKPDPHDSALSVGTSNMDDTAKMRELEVELHHMTDKVASACTSQPRPATAMGRANRPPSQHNASPTTKTTSAS